MRKSHRLILFLLTFSLSLNAQKKTKEIVSTKAKTITVQGQLIGRYDKPPPEVIEIFSYLDNLFGEANWQTSSKNFNIKCFPTRMVDGSINIELSFDEEATKYIRKVLEQDKDTEISIHYNLYVGNKITKYESYCRFKLKDSKDDSADPQTSFRLNRGFIVSDPEELSIFLISQRITEAFDSSSVDKKFMIASAAPISPTNINSTPAINLKELEELQYTLKDSSYDFSTLGKTMSLYNFCNFYLSKKSFFSREADSLLLRINDLGHRIDTLNKNDKRDILLADSLNQKLNTKLESLKLYKLTELRLLETKEKIEGILTRSYLNFYHY